MSTSAAMAAVASSQAAIATSQAHAARTAQCKIVIDTFDSKTASVQQKQQYAECVQLVIPTAMSGPEVIFLKVLFVSALLGGSLGVLSQRHLEDKVLVGLLGFLVAPTALVFIVGIIYGIVWLFK